VRSTPSRCHEAGGRRDSVVLRQAVGSKRGR
jgi:hypothetical protein